MFVFTVPTDWMTGRRKEKKKQHGISNVISVSRHESDALAGREKTCFSSSEMELSFSLRYAGTLVLLPNAF